MSYSLINLFNLSEKRSYAIIGNSKNAGKTTVLNKILLDISEENKIAAVSSIGWDGETVDRVYKTEKPAVIVPEGSFVATCKQLLPLSSSLFKVHYDTGIETILGPIYIVEALNNMKVEVVGPRDLISTKKLIQKLSTIADFTLLDGALNRNTSASSMITDGFIFSIVYSGKETLTEFEKSIKLFYEKYSNFEIISEEKISINVSDLIDKNSVAICSEGNIKFFDFQNPIHNEEKLNEIKIRPDWIYFPGSLTDITFERLSNFLIDIDIIIDDFTKNFLSERVLNILNKRRCKIYYLFSSKLMGITVSTWSLNRYVKSIPAQIISIVKSIFKDYPVVDLFYN